jgi:hypothetical protein
MKILLAVAVAMALALAASSPSAAANVEASAEIGIGYSDNITRLQADEVDETLGSLGLRINALREEGRLTGTLNGDMEFVSYFDDTFDDDVYGRMDLRGRYEFVPDRLAWVLQDSWGQIRSDPFAAPSPLNVENTNWLSTGPEITFYLGSRTRLGLNGRWGAMTYDKSPRDYTSLSGGLELSRQVSERASVALVGNAARIEFDSAGVGNDYDRQETFLRLATEGARTKISVEAGYTAVSDRLKDINDTLLRVTVVRETGPTSRLTLRAGQEFADDGLAFAEFGGPPDDVGGSASALGSGDPFKSRYIGLDWTAGRDRTTFVIGAQVRSETYKTLSGLDRDLWDLHVSLSRRLAESLTLDLGVRWEQEQTDDRLLDDDRLQLGLGLVWDASRRVFSRFDVERYSSSSDNVLRDYDETRIWLRVGYRAR